LSTAER